MAVLKIIVGFKGNKVVLLLLCGYMVCID
uniref:Uncharacterized protein n=1 Tax=Rhizophora mucronata TaxID=61149 RepID=A0A2P2N525_RHIMU